MQEIPNHDMIWVPEAYCISRRISETTRALSPCCPLVTECESAAPWRTKEVGGSKLMQEATPAGPCAAGSGFRTITVLLDGLRLEQRTYQDGTGQHAKLTKACGTCEENERPITQLLSARHASDSCYGDEEMKWTFHAPG